MRRSQTTSEVVHRLGVRKWSLAHLKLCCRFPVPTLERIPSRNGRERKVSSERWRGAAADYPGVETRQSLRQRFHQPPRFFVQRWPPEGVPLAIERVHHY